MSRGDVSVAGSSSLPPRKPFMPQSFLLHQPTSAASGGGTSSSAISTPGRSLLSTLSAATTTYNDGGSAFDAATEDPCVVPWDEVITAVVADARERAAALVMQQRGPLSGCALPCTVVVHHNKVLEITVATHRTGVLPLQAAPQDGEAIASRGRRRLVIPIASIAAISSDLPASPTQGERGGAEEADRHPSGTATRGGGASYGVEISGSPMRALRVTLQLHHDVAQRLADWSAPSKLGRGADHHDERLRPRFVVLYGTSMVEAQRWRAYLQYLCRGNLTEAFGRSPNDRAAAANHMHEVLGRSNDATRRDGGRGDSGDDSDLRDPMGADGALMAGSDPNAPTVHAATAKVLVEGGVPTPAHAAWHWSKCFGQPWPPRVLDAFPLPSLDAQRQMASLQRTAGFGVWCPYGHEWLKRIHSEVAESAARCIAVQEQRPEEEVGDADVPMDGTPWIVMGHHRGNGALHEHVARSHRMKMEVLWRLSTLRRATATAASASGVPLALDDVDDAQPSLGWLDARAKFMAPSEFEAHTAQKYLDVEETMGSIIDSIASRISKGTGILF